MRLKIVIFFALYTSTSFYAVADVGDKIYSYKQFVPESIRVIAVPKWVVSKVTTSPWVNSGSVYGCLEWESPLSLVKLDDSFTQLRACSVNQAQEKTIEYYSERLSLSRIAVPVKSMRVASVQQSKIAVGTRDYVTGVKELAYPAYSSTATFYDCTPFSPDVLTVNEGDDFIQLRDCVIDEGRSRSVYTTYKSGSEVFLRTDSETRTIPYVDSRNAKGTYVNWVAASPAYSAWVNSGSPFQYSTYLPVVNQQTSDFNQNRTYLQERRRTVQAREYNAGSGLYRAVGVETIENEDIERSESRVFDVTYSYSGWAFVSNSNISSWSPSTLTVRWGDPFDQTRTYDERQRRVRSYNTGASRAQYRNLSNVNQSRSNTGKKDYVVGSDTYYGEWTSTGTPRATGDYSNYCRDNRGQRYIYTTRPYEQDQVRTVDKYKRYASNPPKTVYDPTTYQYQTIDKVWRWDNFDCGEGN